MKDENEAPEQPEETAMELDNTAEEAEVPPVCFVLCCIHRWPLSGIPRSAPEILVKQTASSSFL